MMTCHFPIQMSLLQITTWCGHTFSMSHLLEWLESHEHCPVCEAKVEKSSLPEVVETLVAESQTKCFGCEESNATVKCIECDSDFCEDCFAAAHRFPKTFRSHQSMPLGKRNACTDPKCTYKVKPVIDWGNLSSELKQCYEGVMANKCLSIQLRSNSIGNEGAIAIADALRVNTSVLWMALKDNSIGSEGAIAIADALKVNSTVTDVHLEDNSIGNEGAIAIADALKINSTVTELCLHNNSIGNAGVIAIADALKVNSSVSTLWLDKNSIGYEGVIAIAEALKVNSTVSRFHLDYNSIGNEGAIAIADALKFNSTVSEIDLNDNSIGDKGVFAIIEALKTNSTVSRIELLLNFIFSDVQIRESLDASGDNRIVF
ncbi:hypothetical protein GEMRC1_006029 [Eukaryota sp. GEM-RC1]